MADPSSDSHRSQGKERALSLSKPYNYPPGSGEIKNERERDRASTSRWGALNRSEGVVLDRLARCSEKRKPEGGAVATPRPGSKKEG